MSSRTDTLVLSDTNPFSRGTYRWCFEHPADPGRCIKVNRSTRSPETIRRQAPLWKRLRGIEAFDHTLRELRYYREYERHYGDAIWTHVPRCHGMIETDLGPGLVVDLIRDAAGRPAERLSKALKRGGCPGLDDALDTFRTFLLRHRLLTHELRLQNMVIGQPPDGPGPRIYIVDAIGLSDWLPLAYHWNWLAGKKVRSKVERFDARIREARARHPVPKPLSPPGRGRVRGQ